MEINLEILQPNHKVQQWRKFPLNPQKKKALIIFILPKNKNKTKDTYSFLWLLKKMQLVLIRGCLYPSGTGDSHMKGAGTPLLPRPSLNTRRS